MKRLLNIILLSVVLGFSLLVAASFKVMCDEISEKGLKKTLVGIWYGREGK